MPGAVQVKHLLTTRSRLALQDPTRTDRQPLENGTRPGQRLTGLSHCLSRKVQLSLTVFCHFRCCSTLYLHLPNLLVLPLWAQEICTRALPLQDASMYLKPSMCPLRPPGMWVSLLPQGQYRAAHTGKVRSLAALLFPVPFSSDSI
jgi:hypothetical protein